MTSCSFENITGDIVTWKKENWITKEDVILEYLNQHSFCKEPIAKKVVVIPEPVTFSEAIFLTNFLSCKIPSINDDIPRFNSKVKNKLELQVAGNFFSYHNNKFLLGYKLFKARWWDELLGR